MAVRGIDNKVVTQVCIITHDVEKTVANYARILGFTPHEMHTTLGHKDVDVTYYGQPTDARAKFTWFDIGKIQFEVMQPLDLQSSWYDHLEKHGEGIHHIAFFVPDTDAAAQSFIEHGYTITQQGLFTGKSGKYTYLDTDKDLGIVIELLEHFGGSPTLQGPPFPDAQGLGTDVVTQVGIIVKDIEATAQRWTDVFGLPKANIFSTPGYDVVKTTFNGEPSEATAKLAFFSVGQLQIELIEPDEKPSVWRQYLEERGEGPQHIAFHVKNTQQAVDTLGQHGIAISQQGYYGDLSGMYTYMGSDALLGTTVELLENFPKKAGQ